MIMRVIMTMILISMITQNYLVWQWFSCWPLDFLTCEAFLEEKLQNCWPYGHIHSCPCFLHRLMVMIITKDTKKSWQWLTNNNKNLFMRMLISWNRSLLDCVWMNLRTKILRTKMLMISTYFHFHSMNHTFSCGWLGWFQFSYFHSFSFVGIGFFCNIVFSKFKV